MGISICVSLISDWVLPRLQRQANVTINNYLGTVKSIRQRLESGNANKTFIYGISIYHV